MKWTYNWSEDACAVDVVPIMDENKLKEMDLGKEPPVMFSYDRTNYEPEDDETLYICKFEFRDIESRTKAYEIGCNISWEDDVYANGSSAFQHLGRWHVPSEGWGIVVGVTKDHNELFYWANNRASLGGNINFTPVLTDKATSKIVREKPGYDQKLAKLMAKFAQM